MFRSEIEPTSSVGIEPAPAKNGDSQKGNVNCRDNVNHFMVDLKWLFID